MRTLRFLYFSRSRRTKGPAVITVEVGPMEVTGRQISRGEPVSVSTGAVSSSSFQGRGTSVDPSDIHSGSSLDIMPSVEIPELSSVAESVGAELLTAGVRPTLVLSLSLSEKLDYSGDDDVDWEDVHPAPDTSKHSHLAEEEMQISIPRIEPQFGETSTVKGILSFLNHHHSSIINIVWLK